MLAQPKRIEETQAVSYMTLTQNVERRQHRRHDLAEQDLPVYAVIDGSPADTALGQLMDISAGGMRFVTKSGAVRPNSRLAVQLSLPNYAGIRPFIDKDSESPATEWAGYLSVTRVVKLPGGGFEIAGRLLDMSEGERGLLGLYLSTQPLAA
ncbi:MAG TPA: PilZ domain-containing protein [Tepidisphaeraceae bacterium]|jgi:hypothetical protein